MHRAAATGSMSAGEVPVADFVSFLDGPPTARSTTAAAVRAGFESLGFLGLTSHGLPAPVLDGTFAASREFFALQLPTKEAVCWESAASNRGYIPPTGQSLDEAKPWDLKEAYHAGYDDRPPANRWPADHPAFRETVLAFHAAADRVCQRILQAVALAFGVPEDYFGPYFAQHKGATRLLHYPPLQGPPLPGQIRAGAHTDFGIISLLFQDDAGGLEIQRPDGVWQPMPYRPGTAIVNTGDLMERWTNRTFRSSPHRVVNPAGAAAARARYSCVFFYSPSPA